MGVGLGLGLAVSVAVSVAVTVVADGDGVAGAPLSAWVVEPPEHPARASRPARATGARRRGIRTMVALRFRGTANRAYAYGC
ncbi:hypothetical protein CVT27_12430 [Streptomyces cavourensis]|nr:hypothetical protein CVT27_12430 [Streptomyces cavourensis]